MLAGLIGLNGSPHPPVVTSITPDYGMAGGGTAVTITGSYFTGATGAKLNGVSITSFSVVNDNTITGTSAAGSAAALTSVTVTGASGALGTLTNAWTYMPSALSAIFDARYVTVAAGTVTTSFDQSGNGLDMTTIAGYDPPNYNATGVDSLPSMTFVTGALSKSVLRCVAGAGAVSDFIAANALTVFAVVKPSSITGTSLTVGYSDDIILGDQSGYYTLSLVHDVGAGCYRAITDAYGAADQVVTSSNTSDVAVGSTVRIHARLGSGNQYISTNGRSEDTAAAAASIGNVTFPAVFGAINTVGLGHYQGELPFAAWSKSNMSAGDIGIVETYAAHTWP